MFVHVFLLLLCEGHFCEAPIDWKPLAIELQLVISHYAGWAVFMEVASHIQQLEPSVLKLIKGELKQREVISLKIYTASRAEHLAV